MLDSELADGIAWRPVASEAQRAVCNPLQSAAPARLGLVCLGVLLSACGQRAAAAEGARRDANGVSAPRRLGSRIASRTGAESLTFTVQLDAALSRLEIEACPHGFAFERLNAPSPGVQALLAGNLVTPEGDYPVADEGVDVPAMKADECLRYVVVLPKEWPDSTIFRRVSGDILASPDLWLWVPSPRPLGLRMHVHFALPEGVFAALPWAASPISASDFDLTETAFEWKAAGGFTHTPLTELHVAGATLELATLGNGLDQGDATLRAWLLEGARTSSALFGHSRCQARW